MINRFRRISYLSKRKFEKQSSLLSGAHWTKLLSKKRWDYHEEAIRVLKRIRPRSAEKILEIGTVGINLIDGSHTLDYNEFSEGWDFPGKNPDIFHDARSTPWPIASKQYDVVVALRVFQHLVPNQGGALLEAMRIANNVIVVVPENYENPVLPSARGISYSQFVDFLGGTHPNFFKRTQFGDLYHWDTLEPSQMKADFG